MTAKILNFKSAWTRRNESRPKFEEIELYLRRISNMNFHELTKEALPEFIKSKHTHKGSSLPMDLIKRGRVLFTALHDKAQTDDLRHYCLECLKDLELELEEHYSGPLDAA